MDENIAKEIDDGLVQEYDKEEMLRKVGFCGVAAAGSYFFVDFAESSVPL